MLLGEDVGIPSVMAGACLSVRGAAEAMPAATDSAIIDCENFMLGKNDNNKDGSCV